jgi:hypothetical protein
MRKIFSFNGILFILSIILILTIFYKSEIQFDGNRRDYYLIYFIISLVVIFFSIISFFLKKKHKTYLVIIICFSIFTFYLFEFYLTIKVKNNLELIYKKIDNKKKLTNTFNQKNKKTSSGFAISPKIFLNHDNDFFYLTGISNTTSKVCNENGYFSIVNSDKFGFNNPKDAWKNENIDYTLIGDSFIYGNCVNNPFDISSVIRKKTQKNIVNFGIQGNGPLSEYAILREYLNFSSKKILWFFFEGNDLDDLENELKNKVLKKYLSNKKFNQNLINKQKEIDYFYSNYLREISINKKQNKLNNQNLIGVNNFSNLIRFVKLYNLRTVLGIGYKQNYKYEEFFKIIELTNELASENKSQLYFIYLPSFYRYNGNIHKHYHFKKIKKKIRNYIDKKNIVFIDIDELIFDKEKNVKELFALNENSHYSKKGYEKVAELIIRITQQ